MDELCRDTIKFQSTLPLRGATNPWDETNPAVLFQSTLPLRGATRGIVTTPTRLIISIHTPLAGSDWTPPNWLTTVTYFNPHSPCGERLLERLHERHLNIFQSTLPLRGATSGRSSCAIQNAISIHTPLAGSDQRRRLLHAGRNISIHTPLAGSDLAPGGSRSSGRISIHTPLAGSDRRNETFLTK